MYKFSSAEVGVTVVFSEESAAFLLSQKQLSRESEKGGLLFAKPVVGSQLIVISASPPSKSDSSRRNFFKHNQRSSQGIINQHFAEGLAYIGDWHTHLEPVPTPSSRDLRTSKDIFRKSQHNLNYMLMVIVGNSHRPIDWFVGLVDKDRLYQLRVL